MTKYLTNETYGRRYTVQREQEKDAVGNMSSTFRKHGELNSGFSLFPFYPAEDLGPGDGIIYIHRKLSPLS